MAQAEKGAQQASGQISGAGRAVEFLSQGAGQGAASLLKMAGGFAVAQLGVQTAMAAFSKFEQFIRQTFAALEQLEQEVRSVASIMQASMPAMSWADATAGAEAMLQTSRRLGAEI